MAGESAAERWAMSLSKWAIPDEIVRSAPESPWGFPPALFAGMKGTSGYGPSRQAALDALGAGGTVLDIGCGAGAAGVALVPPARHLTGVDLSAGMLAHFAASAGSLGISHDEVQGSWPEVAEHVEAADVVVCHHVVYNVGHIAPFVTAMTAHARRRVVVELTDRHPASNLSPLWQHFWGLTRPEEPSADLFVAVVKETGVDPIVSFGERPVDKVAADPAQYVAFVRRRLCLPADRDAEVAEALAADPAPRTRVVTVSWAAGRVADQLHKVT